MTDSENRPDAAAIRRALAELRTIEQVAVELRVAPNTVRWLTRQPIERGGLPPADAHIGRTPVWFGATVEAFRASRPGQGAGGGRPSRSRTEALEERLGFDDASERAARSAGLLVDEPGDAR